MPEAKKCKDKKTTDINDIYERLKEMIVSRELLPNQKIVEIEISKMLNVSRTPLREALRRLEAEGYVNYYKNKGAVVSYLSPKEIEERFLYFSNMLAFASSLSVEYISEKQIDDLVMYDKQMSACTAQADRIQWVAINQSFHITLLATCPNQYLLSQLTKEGERLWRYWAGAFNMVFDLKEYQDEHKEIINLVNNRDSAGIYRLLYKHTSKFVERIRMIAGAVIT